jgi:hypothetical protein
MWQKMKSDTDFKVCRFASGSLLLLQLRRWSHRSRAAVQ